MAQDGKALLRRQQLRELDGDHPSWVRECSPQPTASLWLPPPSWSREECPRSTPAEGEHPGVTPRPAASLWAAGRDGKGSTFPRKVGEAHPLDPLHSQDPQAQGLPLTFQPPSLAPVQQKLSFQNPPPDSALPSWGFVIQNKHGILHPKPPIPRISVGCLGKALPSLCSCFPREPLTHTFP